ncbi:MAG: hypothetical protein QXW80_06380 [Candidatus Micrarchaeia archaeon]
MKMIDFTHKKRPDLIQLVLIIAVVCLALGAITPSASAVNYDWDFSASVAYESDLSSISWSLYQPVPEFVQYTASTDLLDIYQGSDYAEPFVYYTFPYSMSDPSGYVEYQYDPVSDVVTRANQPHAVSLDDPCMLAGYWLWESLYSTPDIAFEAVARDLYYTYGVDSASFKFALNYEGRYFLRIHISDPDNFFYLKDSVLISGSSPFAVDVVDSGNDYLISVSGIDGSSLAGSAYTIAVSTFTGGYGLPLTSYPMYLGDSPVHFWTTDQTFTLPIYLFDGVTPIDYYCVMSFVGDPTYTGYQFWWNLTTSGYLDYPFNTTYPPVPTPTPLIPSDIIPDPEDLNNTVNITGWYQDMGYEGNNITAPIYSGLRGWFNENLVPVIDFFLTPTNYVATVISDSAETSTDGISYITEELGSYAAPFNTVGAYVVRLVPEVVWLVVFAALSIGYVVLLIKISTGSIRDTIGRFLGGGK